MLIAADYSQIELRILAHLSGDPLMTAAFRDKVDIHTQTAAEVFVGAARTGHHRAAPDREGGQLRAVVRPVRFRARPRARRSPRTQAAEYSRRYFQRFPTIHKFMDEIVAVARAQGGARTLLGRWRPIANLMSKSPAARHAAERVAQNTPMQGTGADLIKLAMLRTTERIAREKWPVKMLLTVHDELVFEAPPKLADEIGAALKEVMESVYKLSVPLEVDIGIGENWADA